MFWKWRDRPWWPGVLVLCFSLGCRTPAPHPDTQTGPRPALTAAEDRRAQALAHYATAVSLAANDEPAAALAEFRQGDAMALPYADASMDAVAMALVLFFIVVPCFTFLLSPLSWWNDLFVNVPLALAFAWVVSWFWPTAFTASFVLGY